MLSESDKVHIVAFFQNVIQQFKLFIGRSFVTRSVKGVQRGRNVFIMMASFSKIELNQPMSQEPIPSNVPPPQDSLRQEDKYEMMIAVESNLDRIQHIQQMQQVGSL